MVLKSPVYCQKTQNFVHFGTYDLVQCSPACGSSTYQMMYGETSNRLPVSAFATIVRTSFNGKFAAKNHFLIGHFMLPLLTQTIKSLK